jgi:hypothetical protein
MERIIKKLSDDMLDLNKMESKNSTQTFDKPHFKIVYSPTSNTIMPIEEAHLGHLINFIRTIKSSSEDTDEHQEDLVQDEERAHEEHQEDDNYPKTSINAFWDIKCSSNDQHEEFHAYNTCSKGPIVLYAPTTSSMITKTTVSNPSLTKTNDF